MDDLCRVRGKSVPLPPSDDESLTDPMMDGADDVSFHGDDDDYAASSSDESLMSVEPTNLQNEIEDIQDSGLVFDEEPRLELNSKTRPSRRIRKVPQSINKNSSQDFTYSTLSSRSLTEDGSNSTEPISTGSSEMNNDIDYVVVQNTTTATAAAVAAHVTHTAASKPVPRKKITIGKKGKINSKKRSFDSYRKKRSSPKNKFKGYAPPTFGSAAASLLLHENTKDTDSKSNDDGNENKLILCSKKEVFVLTQDCCVTCGSFGRGEEGRLLSCSQCGQCYHTYCAGVTGVSKTMLHKGWRCLECTVCEGCGKPTDESRLLLCDECDISYHTYCLDPPLETVPQGTWKCKWCVICLRCGKTTPGFGSHWESNYTLCGRCASQELCSLCKDVYKDNDLIIQCRQCNRWLHAKCDQMNDEDDCEIASCLEFKCANCRSPGEPPCHIQARKNKALKTMLQKRAEQRAESAASMNDKSTPQIEMNNNNTNIKEAPDMPLSTAVSVAPTANPEIKTKYHFIDGVYLTEIGNNAIKSLAIEPTKKARNKRKNLQNGKEEEEKDDGANKDESVGLSAEEKKLKQKQQRLEKLGIGGFFIKQRGRLTSNKDEPEEDPERSSTPDGDKPKRKRRINKKKPQLSDIYPVYLQEAFFGKNILTEAKSETKISDNEDNDECDLKSDNKASTVSVSLGMPLSDSIDTVEDVDEDMNFLDANLNNIHHDDLGPGENFDFDLMNMILDDERNDGLLSELTNNEHEDADDRGDLDLNLDSNLNFGDNFLDSMDGKDVEDLFNEVLSDTSLTKSQDAFPELERQPKMGEQTSQIIIHNQPKVELPPLVSHSLHAQTQQQHNQQNLQSQQPQPPMSLPNHIPSQLQQAPTSQQHPQRAQQQFARMQHPTQVHYDQNIVPAASSSSSSSSQPQQHPMNPQHPHGMYSMSQQHPQTSQAQAMQHQPGQQQAQQQQQPPQQQQQQPPPPQQQQPVEGQWQDNGSNQDQEQSEMSQNQKNTIKWEAEESLGALATISPVLYANKNFPQLKAEYPVWSDRLKQISKLWRQLPTDQRQPYLQMARDNRASNRLTKSQNEVPKKEAQQQQQQPQQPQPVQQQQMPPSQQSQQQQPGQQQAPQQSGQSQQHQQSLPPKSEPMYDPYARPVPTPSMYSPSTPRPQMPQMMQPRAPAPIQSPMSPMLQSPRIRPPHFPQQQSDFRQQQQQGSFSPASAQVQEPSYHSNPGTPQSGADINYKVASPYASNPRTPGMTPFSPMVSSQPDMQFGGQQDMQSSSQQDMYKMPPNMNSKPHTPDSFHQSMPSTPQPNSPALISAQSPVDIYARSPATPAAGKGMPGEGFSQQSQQWNQNQNFSPSYNPDGFVNSPGSRPPMRPPVMQPRMPVQQPIRRSISVDPYSRQPMTPMPGTGDDTNDPSKQQHLRNLLQVSQVRRQDSLPANPSPRPNWNDSGFRQPISPAMARPRAPFPVDQQQQQRMPMNPRTVDPRFRQMSPQHSMQRFSPQQNIASPQQPNMMQQQPSPQQNPQSQQQQQWMKPMQQQGIGGPQGPPPPQQHQQVMQQDQMMGMHNPSDTFDSLPVELVDDDLLGLEENLDMFIVMADNELQKDNTGGDMAKLQKSDSIDSSQSESLSLSENDFERLLNEDIGQPMQQMPMQQKPHPQMQQQPPAQQQAHFQQPQQMFQQQPPHHSHPSPSHPVQQGQQMFVQQPQQQQPQPSQEMYSQQPNQWQDPNAMQQPMRPQQAQQQFQQPQQFAQQRMRMPLQPGQAGGPMQRHPMMVQGGYGPRMPMQQQPVQQQQQPPQPGPPPPLPSQQHPSVRPPIPAPSIPEPHMISDHNRHLLIPYEQWLVNQGQHFNQAIKYHEDEVAKLRKIKKSLNAKKRQAKKNQSDIAESENTELNRLTVQITGIQKQMEQLRKQKRQHGTAVEDYNNKYSSNIVIPALAANPATPMQASPRPVNSPMANLNVSGPNTPHGIGSTPQSPAIPCQSPGQLMQNSPMTPMMTPQSPMNHGPQILQDDTNPFSDGFMQKEKKQVVKPHWMQPGQQGPPPPPQQHYSPNSGYNEPNPGYYQQQAPPPPPIQQQIPHQPQQFQQIQRPPMPPQQQQHYVQQGDQYRQFPQQQPQQQQPQQQHYVQNQTQMQYQQAVRRPPPPPYPGNLQPQQQPQQQFVPRPQMPPQQGQYMRSQMVMQQQHMQMQSPQQMPMQSPQHQQQMMAGGMQEMTAESFSFSYVEEGILEGNGSDPVTFQNEMLQQNGGNVTFPREAPRSQVPAPVQQNVQNEMPVETIKSETTNTTTTSTGTNGHVSVASAGTTETPVSEEPKEKQNALLKQLLQNCPAADDKVPDTNSVGSSHSRTSTPTIPYTALPQQSPIIPMPVSQSEDNNSEIKSGSESSFQMNQTLTNDIVNGDMSNISMDSTGDSADSVQVVQEKKLTYLELRKEQLLKEPTPPPGESKPKRKRTTKRKDKSVDDVNENSNSSIPATSTGAAGSTTPKVKVKRPRKGSQNHRPEENGATGDSNEQLFQQVLDTLKKFPTLSIIQPKISTNFNFCLPPNAPDMNSKVPELKGAFGDAQPVTGFDYYSAFPFGPNKASPTVPNYPSSTNALFGKRDGNVMYFDEFGAKLPNLDEHLKERGDIFKNYSLHSRDLNSPETIISCSSPETAVDDEKNEFNSMKHINEFYEDENKNSIERSSSPVLYMPIAIPALKANLEENKENIQDGALKDYSNVTLMVRVDDPKAVIDSLAKILGIDETLIMYEYAKGNEFDNGDKCPEDEELNNVMNSSAVSLDEVLPMELEDNDIEEKEVAQIFEKDNNKAKEEPNQSSEEEECELAPEAVGNISLDDKKWKDRRYFHWKPSTFNNECKKIDAEHDKAGKELDRLQICVRPRANTGDKRMCMFCKGIGDSDNNGPSRLLNMDVDQWVHLNCALWSPDVVELLNGALMHVQKEFRRACKEKCVCCGELGASLKCFKPKCTNQYHFPCALKAKCAFYKDKSLFCSLHAPKSVIPNPDEMTSFTVWRKVFINREESSQIAAMIRTGYEEHLIRIGSLIFLNIGQLLPHQLEAFHNPSYIYPIGYKISRFYWSTRQLGKRCQYICSIHEVNSKPEFRIEIREDGFDNLFFKDKTAKGVWEQVITPIRKMREAANTIKVFNDFITGEDLFGLNEPTIVRILESLPGVDQLTDYNFKFGRSPFYELPLAINPSGSARTEVFMKSHFKRPHTLRAPPTSSKTFQTALVTTIEPSSPYVKQFVHSKLSQYRKMKLEWRSNVYLARSRIAGLGLYAKREIEKHTMIIEYIGLVIRNEVSERNERIHEEHKRGIYMFRLDENRVIDATLEGGLARYINHSCDPNCVAELVPIERENKILIIANRKILEGEELSYDYKFEIEDDQHKIPCLCGAANCKKWMN